MYFTISNFTIRDPASKSSVYLKFYCKEIYFLKLIESLLRIDRSKHLNLLQCHIFLLPTSLVNHQYRGHDCHQLHSNYAFN